MIEIQFIFLIPTDVILNDQETVRCIQSCYLYALYIQMLTTRTQSQAKTIFRSLLQVRMNSSFFEITSSRIDFRLFTFIE